MSRASPGRYSERAEDRVYRRRSKGAHDEKVFAVSHDDFITRRSYEFKFVEFEGPARVGRLFGTPNHTDFIFF